MSRESILLAAVLCVLALVALYVLTGSRVSDRWRAWMRGALGWSVGSLCIGMLLLGLPGALFVDAVVRSGRQLAPDSAWPLAIFVTLFGSLMIVPASLLLRLAMPGAVGLQHAGGTALLTIVATFVFTLVIA